MSQSARVANQNTGFTSLTCSRIQLYDNAEYCCSIFSSLGFPKLIKMTGMNLKELANDFLVSFFLSFFTQHSLCKSHFSSSSCDLGLLYVPAIILNSLKVPTCIL